MALLYPFGLLALAGLIIPVLIHLWSVKQGKVLKIGSIALLGENATASSKSIKITDLLLFILRCLIIVLIACVIALPYFKTTALNQKNKGWILMEKAQLKQAYQTNRPSIDSLLNLGFELRDFNSGFNKFDLKDSALRSSATANLNYSSLLNQLNEQIPAGYAAHIFADRKLLHFEGNLPKPNFSLVWNDLQVSDTLKTWTTKFLDKTYKGKSTPSFTSYSSDLTQNLPIVNVVIYEGNDNDSRYIKAALNAIADFTKRKIIVDNWNTLSSSKADVLFWLSEQPIERAKYKKGASLITYQKGKIISVNSTLQVSSSPNQHIPLTKRIAPDNLKGSSVWIDGFGQPVLLKEYNSNFNHFHFYSRFNPQWTELVWNEQFVKALIPIVLGQSIDANFGFEDHDADQRVLAQRQIPVSNYKTTNVFTTHSHRDITEWIWVIAFIFLIVERILSLRKKTNSGYVSS